MGHANEPQLEVSNRGGQRLELVVRHVDALQFCAGRRSWWAALEQISIYVAAGPVRVSAEGTESSEGAEGGGLQASQV